MTSGTLPSQINNSKRIALSNLARASVAGKDGIDMIGWREEEELVRCGGFLLRRARAIAFSISRVGRAGPLACTRSSENSTAPKTDGQDYSTTLLQALHCVAAAPMRLMARERALLSLGCRALPSPPSPIPPFFPELLSQIRSSSFI